MPHILEPDSIVDNLDQNPDLDKTLTRVYAAFMPSLQERYPLLGLPAEAKTGGQRVHALRRVMRAGMLMRREGGNYKLVAVVELWTILLERTTQYARDLEQKNSVAMYSYLLAAGTAEELDAAVQTWQQEEHSKQ